MSGEEQAAPILESKLYPATGTRRPLPRPRLDSFSDVLDGGYPVVLVVAPAGYGKSTLMARWHAQLLERGRALRMVIPGPRRRRQGAFYAVT